METLELNYHAPKPVVDINTKAMDDYQTRKMGEQYKKHHIYFDSRPMLCPECGAFDILAPEECKRCGAKIATIKHKIER